VAIVSIVFVLTEKIGIETKHRLVFPQDLTIVTFGRSPLCEYQLLSERIAKTDRANQRISAIQATLELRSDGWVLIPGSTPESVRGVLVPKKPGSPFWIGDQPSEVAFIRMAIGSAIYIYREDVDYCLLSCTDESGLEQLLNPESRGDDTQSYSLLGELQSSTKASIVALEKTMTTSIGAIMTSIEALYQNDRIQSQRIDSAPLTNLKYSCALALLFCGGFGFTQLLDQTQRKDLIYKLLETGLTIGASGGGFALFKDAIDKRKQND
jgi:hypothetical protein